MVAAAFIVDFVDDLSYELVSMAKLLSLLLLIQGLS